MPAQSLTAALKSEAHRLGFELCGACPAVEPPGLERFHAWLSAGYAGQMRYLADRADAYRHPRDVLDAVQSILMLAKAYRSVEPKPPGLGEGRVSRYAWGLDYHRWIRKQLRKLAQFHRRLAPQARVRGVVDTAPLLERDFAQLAGLGWIGKNTLLLNRGWGSWFFLAALLTTEPLEYDEPFRADHCGTCRACVDACPTGALVAPHCLDARKCISYLSIEFRGTVSRELRPAIGDWLFGCDVCQEVCPWNRRTPVSSELAFQPAAGMNPVKLAEVFVLDDEAFRQRYRETPLWRPGRGGIVRNAASVLGNRPDAPAVSSLIRGLEDAQPAVRAACAWALVRHDNSAASAALRQRLAAEPDPEVRREIELALETPSQERPANSATVECSMGR